MGRRSLVERTSQTLKRLAMDDEEATQFVFRETFGFGNLLEAGAGVKASERLFRSSNISK
jgi:hypothetical protein